MKRMKRIFSILPLFLPVTILDRTALEETLTGRVPLEFVSQTWFLEHLREDEKTWYETLKRIMDIVLAIPIVVVTFLLLPFISLAMAILSPGPIFYSQMRTGKLNKPFIILITYFLNFYVVEVSVFI